MSASVWGELWAPPGGGNFIVNGNAIDQTEAVAGTPVIIDLQGVSRPVNVVITRGAGDTLLYATTTDAAALLDADHPAWTIEQASITANRVELVASASVKGILVQRVSGSSSDSSVWVWAIRRGPAPSIAAPSLAFVATDEDLTGANVASWQTPGIAFDLPNTAEVGDVLRVQLNNADLGTRTLDADDIDGPFVDFVAASPGPGTYDMRCRLERGGGDVSNWSNTLAFEILTAPSVDVTYSANNVINGAGQTTFAFTGLGIGAADPNRVVVLALGMRGTSTYISSVLINGSIPAKLAARSPFDSEVNADIWYAHLPTGTSIDVTVTTAATAFRVAIASHRLLTSHPDPIGDVQGNSVVSADTGAGQSRAVTLPAGGIGFAVYHTRNSVASATTWSNATSLSDVLYASAARMSTAKFTAGATVGAVPGANPTRSAFSIATWKP